MAIKRIGDATERVDRKDPPRGNPPPGEQGGFREHLQKQAELTLPNPLPASQRRKPATGRKKRALKDGSGITLDVDA